MTARFRPATLRRFVTDVVRGLGGTPEAAAAVSESLVDANRRGKHTHGIRSLSLYAEMVDDGALDPTAEPAVESVREATVAVDGRDAFGHLTSQAATDAAIPLAVEHGVSVAAVRNGSHLGELGEWARRAAADGLVFLAFTNTGGGALNTAPADGHRRKLSTNPVAFGFPTFSALPFNVVADFATSQISGSVIRDRFQRGEPLREEWTTTASGDPVADPKDFLDGDGALLSLGGRATGHKGYGLSVAAELLGGITGGDVVGGGDPDWFSNAAVFFLLDPTVVLDHAAYEAVVSTVAAHLRSDDVRLPGEGAHRHAELAAERGVELSSRDLAAVRDIARRLDVPLSTEVEAALADLPDADSSEDDVQTW